MLYPVPDIVIGHDPNDYFWFRLVKCHNKIGIQDSDIELSDCEISVVEGMVEDLLYRIISPITSGIRLPASHLIISALQRPALAITSQLP